MPLSADNRAAHAPRRAPLSLPDNRAQPFGPLVGSAGRDAARERRTMTGRKRRPARLAIHHRPRNPARAAVVVYHRGRRVFAGPDYDAARAFIRGWREGEAERDAARLAEACKAEGEAATAAT